MKITRLDIPDIYLLDPKVFEDNRGFFYESFNLKTFHAATGTSVDFVQDNHSRSAKSVIRGLHYQLAPKGQGKIVRVVKGSIFDVAVDIRAESPTSGKWVGVTLSAENKKQIWIPEGFAHGFMSLEDDTEVIYKTTEYYSPEHECSIRWNDSYVAVDWPDGDYCISEKDKDASHFSDAHKM